MFISFWVKFFFNHPVMHCEIMVDKLQRCQSSGNFLISGNFAQKVLYNSIGKNKFSGNFHWFQDLLTILTGISECSYLMNPICWLQSDREEDVECCTVLISGPLSHSNLSIHFIMYYRKIKSKSEYRNFEPRVVSINFHVWSSSNCFEVLNKNTVNWEIGLWSIFELICLCTLQDKHCSQQALKAAQDKRAKRALNSPSHDVVSRPTQPPVVYNAHNAFHAIRRSLHSPSLKDLLVSLYKT